MDKILTSPALWALCFSQYKKKARIRERHKQFVMSHIPPTNQPSYCRISTAKIRVSSSNNDNGKPRLKGTRKKTILTQRREWLRNKKERKKMQMRTEVKQKAQTESKSLKQQTEMYQGIIGLNPHQIYENIMSGKLRTHFSSNSNRKMINNNRNNVHNKCNNRTYNKKD